MPRRVAIVGGGITGLAAAYELERDSDAQIDLYEAAPRLGGKLRTDVEGDLLVERGPDSLFTRRVGLFDFLHDLGLEAEIVEPKQGEFLMLVGGRLHPVPRGLVTLNAVRPEAIEAATFLSPEGKARALREPAQPVGCGEDESIRSFFDRRFGEEFTRRVVEPLMAGTHGGAADRLSMKALYPTYLDWERTRGSTVPVERVQDRPGRATFVSFRNGMQTLIDALTGSLKRTTIHLNVKLDALPEADRTLLAIPSNHAAHLLPGVGLERIGYRSSAIATYAFPREAIDHPLDGTGFLVPSTEGVPITGATWSSAKWPHRAPDDTVLIRVFLREPTDALAAIRPLMRISGEPTFSRIDRWIDALPQYEVGHLHLVDAIESRLPTGVLVAGTSYRGVGVPDCLRQGRDAGRKLSASL